MRRIRSAMADDDAGMVKKQAHALRGSSVVFGLAPVIAACMALERQDEAADDRNVLITLEQAVGRASQHLKRAIDIQA